jgi:hypothetical protein
MTIRRQSKVRAIQSRQYLREVTAWKVGKRCAFPRCGKVATECHHVRGRIGRLLLDRRFWLPVCLEHHRRIHERPAEARSLGLLARPGEWNTVPKETL